MKDTDKFENAIRDFCQTQHAAARTTPQFDRKVMDNALPAQQEMQQKSPALAGLGIINHARRTWY